MLLMVVGVVLGVRAARHRLPMGVARTALAVGVVVAAFAAFLIHRAVVTAPLFPQPQEVPSVVDSAPSPQYAAAVERARGLVRAAILDQNLPGVSVAVGIGVPSGAWAEEDGTLVWAEGFGWRDVVTRTPVSPDTRFNIGTAASAVTAAVGLLGLTQQELTRRTAARFTLRARVRRPPERPPGRGLLHLASRAAGETFRGVALLSDSVWVEH